VPFLIHHNGLHYFRSRLLNTEPRSHTRAILPLQLFSSPGIISRSEIVYKPYQSTPLRCEIFICNSFSMVNKFFLLLVLMGNMYSNSSGFDGDLAYYVLVSFMKQCYIMNMFLCVSQSLISNIYMQGSSSFPAYTNHMDSAFISDLPIYNIQHECSPNSSFSILIHQSPLAFPKGLTKTNSNLQYQNVECFLLKTEDFFLLSRGKLCPRLKYVAE